MQTTLTTEMAKLVFDGKCGALICCTLQEAGNRVIAEAAASDTTWSATVAAFDDECLSAIELLDLTLGDWEPCEGWNECIAMGDCTCRGR
jgi:hypothetical protein